MLGQTFQQYRIVQKLGEGGMGEVYLADDLELHRKVALKFLPAQLSSNPDLKARFKREAQAAAALNHPNIITIYQVGEVNNQAFIAMEYVEGKSLRDMLNEEGVPQEQALDIVIQCCEGLGMAHEHGIVHRDVKPANIMVDRYGRVKILDFGLAKVGDVTRLTKAGTTMGTPHYMSPEQVKGVDLNHQSDIYSLGVVLYELLCGQLPFEGYYEAAILYSIANEKPTPITRHKPDLQPGLVRIIDRALEKKLQKRYQHTDEMRQDLEHERQSLRMAGQPTVTSFRLPKTSRPSQLSRGRGPRYAFLAGAGVVLLGVGLLLSDKLPWSTPSGETGTVAQPRTPHQKVSTTKDRRPEPSGPVERVAVTPRFGELEVTSNPSGAEVWLNGRRVGRTPFSDAGLTPDTYRLRLTLAGYKDYRETVQLQAGRRLARTAQLIPLPKPPLQQLAEKNPTLPPTTTRSTIPQTGSAEITSVPPDAEVWLDQRKVGSTPYKADALSPGTHSVVLKKSGYADYSTTLQVEPGKRADVVGQLKPLPGQLRILVKPYGSIFIDGRLHKNDWEFVYPVELTAGNHTVKAVHPTLGEWEKSVSVPPGQTRDLVIDFRKKVEVVVSVSRGWATVFVDGQAVGDTPKPVMLNVGRHTIEIRRPGYATQKRTILVEEGMNPRIIFDLKKQS